MLWQEIETNEKIGERGADLANLNSLNGRKERNK